MSFTKEVDLRSQKYYIYSSEMKERMKVYQMLHKDYSKCMQSCP